MSPKRVAIIGAGPAGLPSARWAKAYGWEPVVFELQEAIGGLWRYKPGETELSTVMRSTVINTSKEMTAYSDFPPRAEDANFMHNTKMLRYFQDYTKHFGIDKCIRFRHKVENVTKAPDYDQTGRWIVHFTNDQSERKEETFDAVLTCIGHHANPYIPEPWPGQDKFTGQILHSKSYKCPEGFAEKRVLVVGVGNSGMDVSCELGRIGRQVYLSTRRGAWVTAKLTDHGYPIDMWLNTRYHVYLRRLTPAWFFPWLFERKLQRVFDHDKFGLRPRHKCHQQHVTMSDELHGKIASGTVQVKPDLKAFTENGVVFQDGTYADVDAVILSTGYWFSYPFLDSGRFIPVANNEVRLWKNMYPLNGADRNTNVVIGLVQPQGSIMPIAEMQARLFFAAANGDVQLPDAAQMLKEMEHDKEVMHKRYVGSNRHTVQVDYTEYMSDLGARLGCVPNPFAYLLTDPHLCYRLIFHPDVPYCYRLVGRDAWSGARAAILGVDERMVRATRTRDCGVCEKSTIPASALMAALLLLVGIVLVFWK